MKDQEPEAYADYRNRIASYGGQTNDTIQALLIHWSHEELFFQLQPREYNRTLNQINYLLTHHLKPNESLYYVSDGNFLILSSDSERDLKSDYMTVLKPQLEGLVFQRRRWGSGHPISVRISCSGSIQSNQIPSL